MVNTQAAYMATICTLSIGAISAAVKVFVDMATTGHIDSAEVLGSAGCLGLGSFLLYLGHCRALLPPKPPAQP